MKTWPIRKAVHLLIGSFCATLALSLSVYWLQGNWKRKRKADPRFNIAAIIQTGPEKEALKTDYLAQLLELSIDAPKNLYAFDVHEAAKALLTSPLIKEASVKKIAPNTLYVDYEVRKPVAWLADYRNTAIDEQGYLFPMAPFFSPKEMPEIYLGAPPFASDADSNGREGGRWRRPLRNKYTELAFALLRAFDESPWKEGLTLKRIDVSNAFAPSLGRREIVLFTEEEISFRKGERELAFQFPKILRLSTSNYLQQLLNFFALKRSMHEDYKKQLATLKEGALKEETRFAPRIVDLRVPQLAFVEK